MKITSLAIHVGVQKVNSSDLGNDISGQSYQIFPLSAVHVSPCMEGIIIIAKIALKDFL